MESDSHEFLLDLLETPSPSGYEQPIQRVVRDYVEKFSDEVTTDVHGSVIACRNPGQDLRVLLDGHCDQIGLLVTQIDDNGFIYTQPIGGWDPQQLIGQRMTIWAETGPVQAVISRKPIHLLEDEEKKQAVKAEDLWLDIGAKSKDEAAGIVRIGDPVTLELGYREMRNNCANAPGMDDKTGLWVVLEAMRRVSGRELNCSLYTVSAVQEEIGLRGTRTSAFGIDPHVGIAVDVTHATDCPTIDKRQRGEIQLGDGPVIFRGPNMNPAVVERLIRSGQEHSIPLQLAAIGRGAPNDSNALQLTRAGVATGLIGVPNRYMHSAVETISLDDIDHAADLLAEFVSGISSDDDFTPR